MSDFGFRVRERFLYEYDFGDQWQHDVRLERKIALDPRKTYPLCTGGRRACPPEDCGGARGYLQWEDGESVMDTEEHLLEALQDGDVRDIDFEEISSMVRWLDRNRFDRRQVNQIISKRCVKSQSKRWTEQGAHLLLQVRTMALNGELRSTFER